MAPVRLERARAQALVSAESVASAGPGQLARTASTMEYEEVPVGRPVPGPVRLRAREGGKE